jgi:hypothetical protein
MRDFVLPFVCLLVVAGCGEPQKPAAAVPAAPRINPAMVRVTKLEPPTGCTEVGSITAGMVFSYDSAIDSLREKTAERGGDWLTLDYPTAGRAFWCPPAVVNAYDAARNVVPGTPAPAAAPYAMLCEPDCSPGFTCVRGQCVEACNPKCVAPARCGADRICH